MAIKLLNYNVAKLKLRENIGFKYINLDSVLKDLDRHIQEHSDHLSRVRKMFFESDKFVFVFKVWVDKPIKNYGYNTYSTTIVKLDTVRNKETSEEIILVERVGYKRLYNQYVVPLSQYKRQSQGTSTSTQKCI